MGYTWEDGLHLGKWVTVRKKGVKSWVTFVIVEVTIEIMGLSWKNGLQLE